MIPYLGCETAREMLDAFADGELPMADQVAVEAHLRWCRTCTARLDDLCLIGSGIRVGSAAAAASADDAQALAAIQSGVLTRIRAEHDQSFRMRVRELFIDMRLLWPALGASVAVLICLCGAFSVLQLATREQPDSLAAMIDSLADPDRYPLRLDSAMTVPRALDNGPVLDAINNHDTEFAVATVLTREGRISGYQVLNTEATSGEVEALLHAVRQSRFEPAQVPGGGRTVAVNMVWLFAWTKVERDGQLEELLKGSARNKRVRVEALPANVPAAPPTEKPAEAAPVGQRSSTIADSTTA